ncbi:hypothetical protein [Dietzia aurantiaca]|uniref:Uncharacterized protein n=1 Tax=Dietzia aurantiaca TaxID=983873 RepID=A0ABV9PQC9_9ACTN
MSLTVPDVMSWDLDTVCARVDDLRADEELLLDSAAAVRAAAGAHLVGFAGDTVSASTGSCAELTRDITIVARKAGSAVRALTDFCHRAPGLRSRLLDAVEEAAAARCRVADDGTVRGPLLIGDPSDPEVARAHQRGEADASAIESRILPLLRGLEDLDLAAANALNLMSMTESYVHYPYEPELIEVDPRTVAAGAAVSGSLDALDSTAEVVDAASAVTRSLPVLGTGLGLAIGLATRPEHESLGEALAIESAGVAASALAGAAAGSVLPGPGTALGFALGAGVRLLAGPAATAALRNHIERERADGKEGFGW